MQAVIVLAIIVATGNSDDQAIEAMRAAASEALGAEEFVAVREVEPASDDEALRIERSVKARSIVQVSWLDAGRSRARLRLHVAHSDHWTVRTISFDQADTLPERGRTLGLAVVSMLPEETLAARSRRLSSRGDEPDSGAPVDLPRTGLRLVAIGSVGLGGTAGGIGGGFAAERFLTSLLALRAGVGARTGDVPGLNGTDLTTYAALGISLWPARPAPNRRVAVGVRLDALALHHDLSHRSMDVLARQSRWLPGADVLAEIGWTLTPSVELVTTLGVEVAFGATDVLVEPGGGPVATIPALRVVAEGGIRIWF
jgi:hypothetical protein